MLLSLRRDHKEHLGLLTTQSPQVVVDFCKLAIDFLQNGVNEKLCSVAAQKLNIEQTVVQNCVYGLVNLLLLACKHRLSEADFRDSVLTIGFGQEQQVVLTKFYLSKEKDILQILSKLDVKDPHYHDLDWRFEVIISSRSLLQQVTPLITMDLQLKQDDDEGETKFQHILLQTDPNNLLHITEELERALIESRSRHSRKIQRAFNV